MIVNVFEGFAFPITVVMNIYGHLWNRNFNFTKKTISGGAYASQKRCLSTDDINLFQLPFKTTSR